MLLCYSDDIKCHVAAYHVDVILTSLFRSRVNAISSKQMALMKEIIIRLLIISLFCSLENDTQWELLDSVRKLMMFINSDSSEVPECLTCHGCKVINRGDWCDTFRNFYFQPFHRDWNSKTMEIENALRSIPKKKNKYQTTIDININNSNKIIRLLNLRKSRSAAKLWFDALASTHKTHRSIVSKR